MMNQAMRLCCDALAMRQRQLLLRAHSLMRPEAVELHMQNSAMGLPFVSKESVNTAEVVVNPPAWLRLLHLCW